MSYILSCCSTCDISAEHISKLGARYIPFHFFLDGVEYPDDLGQSMPYDKFYDAMKNGADTKTSQVAVGEYIDYFTPMLGAGNDIIHLTLSSGISGSYRSALAARDILKAEFPERKLLIVDTLAASSGYGLLLDMTAAKRDEGLSIEELEAWVNENKLYLHHWFFSTDLTFYVKGGRVSKTAGFVGGLLSICPLLYVDTNGKLTPHSKIRTKNKVITAIVDKMAEYAKDGEDYSGKCFICNSAVYDDARAVADMIEERFPKLCGKVVINSIGTTIGSHTGPGTVAVFFEGRHRSEVVI